MSNDLTWIAEYVTERIGHILSNNGREIQARSELNAKIDQTIRNAYHLSSDEICMWLRSTWRVRLLIRNWEPLLLEAEKLLSERHGKEGAKNYLFGLHIDFSMV